MGKSKVWVNGTLLKEHYGGFLPVIVNVTSYLKYGQDNVIAVWADNSDDASYPPRERQRICWTLRISAVSTGIVG